MKSVSLFPFSKILQNCYLGFLILPPCRKLWYLAGGKRTQLHRPCFSGNIAKICKLPLLCILYFLYFGYFGNICLDTPNMVKSTCRKFRCFSTCQKSTLNQQHFGPQLEYQNFPRYVILTDGEISITILAFILDYF